MNGEWYSGTQPLLQSFVNGSCKWRTAAKEATKYLNQYEISSQDAANLQNEVRKLIEAELNK